jgi:hypothetical protein
MLKSGVLEINKIGVSPTVIQKMAYGHQKMAWPPQGLPKLIFNTISSSISSRVM